MYHFLKKALFSLLLSVGLIQAESSLLLGDDTHGDERVTVTAHGLGARREHAWYYHCESGQPNAFIIGKLHTFNFNDVDDLKNTCLGQGADITLLHKAVQEYPDCALFGWSRGAVTIANYLGSYPVKNVDEIVLESPFADIRDVVKQRTGFACLTRFLPWLYPNHDPNGIQPIKVACKVNKEIPMFIFCSKEDALIPAKSSIAYYEQLRKCGHNKVHILVVDHGAHANILNDKDGHIVRNVIHAFRRAYGKPHNSYWADLGQARFEQCQPPVAA